MLSTPPPPPPPATASLRPQAGLSGPPASFERVSVRRPRRNLRVQGRPPRATPRRCPSGKPRRCVSSRGAGGCGGGGRQADSGCWAAGEHARAAPLNGAFSATPRPAAAAGDAAAAPRAPAPAAPRLRSRWARFLLRLWGVSGARGLGREETQGVRVVCVCGGAGVLLCGADHRSLSLPCN